MILKDYILINLTPTEGHVSYFTNQKNELNEKDRLELENLKINLKLLSSLSRNPKGLNELFTVIK